MNLNKKDIFLLQTAAWIIQTVQVVLMYALLENVYVGSTDPNAQKQIQRAITRLARVNVVKGRLTMVDHITSAI